ncbi:transmembrane 220 family protein [Aridibaculum aurantiacum]|uniref:transmembrane 220 family protein n=1 Tax=Aridibaculum aurantiacum TaxID=2810307 RepID=UPI001A95A9BF|nr:transmembrane 220 family protein [Aridibaculum aurantiacum]
MRLFNIVFLILFVLSAALQYNDPDPFLWMPLYLYGAFLCFRALQNRYNRTLFIIGLAVYIPFAIYLFFEKDGVLSWMNDHAAENIVQSMKATKPWIEETREFFGLLLLIIALTANMIWLSRKSQKLHLAIGTE